jgi:hypothetical protein
MLAAETQAVIAPIAPKRRRCNGAKARCTECNGALPEGRAKFCSDQCGGRHRVRKHRRGETSSEIGKASKQQVDARVSLRRGAKTERAALVTKWRQKLKDYRDALRVLKAGKKRLAAELKAAIRVSDATIASEYERLAKGLV